MSDAGKKELCIQQIVGHELMLLAMIACSNEKKHSFNFIREKQIIAMLNYHQQKVIMYPDDENYCEFSYETFTNMLQEKRQQPGELENDAGCQDEHDNSYQLYGFFCNFFI